MISAPSLFLFLCLPKSILPLEPGNFSLETHRLFFPKTVSDLRLELVKQTWPFLLRKMNSESPSLIVSPVFLAATLTHGCFDCLQDYHDYSVMRAFCKLWLQSFLDIPITCLLSSNRSWNKQTGKRQIEHTPVPCKTYMHTHTSACSGCKGIG